jgi:CspA family cold shock protein
LSRQALQGFVGAAGRWTRLDAAHPSMQEPPMVTGTVKWFDVKKGFGFLVNAEGKDVFVHFSSIEGDGFRALKDGEKVEYEEVDSGKGLAARNVKRLRPDGGMGAPIAEAQTGNRGDGFAAGAPSPG